jgi:hypothetical protein
MFRRLAIPALLALAVVAGAGAARGEPFQNGNLRITFDGNFAPRSLPRDRPAPVTVSIDGSIATTDGSHPPPLRRFEIALNRNGRLSSAGLPACTSALLQSTTTETALARCRPALVGRGRYRADLASTQAPIPVRGTILVFNGRRSGRPALFLHLYGTVPVRATFVLPLVIGHRPKGQFGTVLSAKIPVLAGGVGSITEIDLKIGRRYSLAGRRLSFLSASCAAPPGFPGAIFTFARGSFYFAGGKRIDTPLTRNCSVR